MNRKVLLRTAPDAFGARVIAARLGADGVPTELRGNLGGPYSFGYVSVWVDPEDEEIAKELLLADEVESAFDPRPEGWVRRVSLVQMVAAIAMCTLMFIASFVVAVT